MNGTFLDDLVDLIDNGKDDLIDSIIENNLESYIELEDVIAFSRVSGAPMKKNLRGAININGSGGSGYIKPNLSSIAALYLGLTTDHVIVKTGSSSFSGIYGSTEFFMELGFLDAYKRDYILGKYGFAYYDYLEVSPWKKYKQKLRKNKSLDDIFWKVVFLDYKASYYFLGISNPKYYEGMRKLQIENSPGKLVAFYSVINNTIVDELLDSDIYINNKLYMKGKGKCESIGRGEIERLKRINKELIMGINTGFWRESLKITYSVIACRVGIVTNIDEGKEMFEKCYSDKIVMKVLKEIGND